MKGRPAAGRAALYDLRDALADFPIARSDDALRHLLKTCCGWLRADNAFWVGAVRVAGGAAARRDSQRGWRGLAATFLRSNSAIEAQTRAAIRAQSAVRTDDATRALAAGAGKFRVHRLRDGFVDFAAFSRSAPYEALFRAAGVSDRMWVVTPVGADAESYLVFNHVRSRRRFSPADAAFAVHALRGLKWFHRQLMMSYGLPATREPLSPAQRRVLLLLLEGLPKKTIAQRLGLAGGTVHQYAADVYRKLAVKGRAELAALWLGR